MKSILSSSKKMESSQDFPQNNARRTLGNSSAISQSRKVQISEPEDGKKEDQYVEKLHAHITFLNKTVRDMKKKQEEYKSGLVDMLSRDAKPLPDLATDSQAKYKEMKQALTAQINALENLQAKTENKHLGLLKKTEKYKDLLDELDKKHNEMELANKKKNQEIKERQKKEKDHREELDEEVEKWKIQHEKQCADYEQRVKEIEEKRFFEDLNARRYNQDKELEEDDETEKKKELAETERKLKELVDRQEQDFAYQNLKQKNLELNDQLRSLGEEYEKLRYESFTLDALVKLGEQEKDKESEERKKLRDEYDKQSSILEEYKRKNREKVEKQFETANLPALNEIQKKLNKIKKQAKEMQDKYLQNDASFKKLKQDQMKKGYTLERTKQRVQELKNSSNLLIQEVNEREVEYLEMMTRIQEHEAVLQKLTRDEEKLSKNNQKLVIEMETLEVRADHYEKTVKLQDLVQDMEFADLEKTQQSNVQFLDSLKNLKNLKEEVRTSNAYP